MQETTPDGCLRRFPVGVGDRHQDSATDQHSHFRAPDFVALTAGQTNTKRFEGTVGQPISENRGAHSPILRSPTFRRQARRRGFTTGRRAPICRFGVKTCQHDKRLEWTASLTSPPVSALDRLGLHVQLGGRRLEIAEEGRAEPAFPRRLVGPIPIPAHLFPNPTQFPLVSRERR